MQAVEGECQKVKCKSHNDSGSLVVYRRVPLGHHFFVL